MAAASSTSDAPWSRDEQQLLQDALRRYPPSIEKTERWQAIALAVPGRSPADCLSQCRLLAAAVRATSAEDAASRRRNGMAKAEEAKQAEAKAAAAERREAARAAEQAEAAAAAKRREEAARAKALADKPARWWTRELVAEVDPISLEPLRSLRYPPFECRAESAATLQPQPRSGSGAQAASLTPPGPVLAQSQPASRDGQ